MESSNQKLYQPLTRKPNDMDMNLNSAPPSYDLNMDSQQAQSQPLTQQQPTIVVAPQSAPAMMHPVQVGPESMEINCPSCHCRIKTRIRHRSTTKTHIACILLSWTCCCCCLPYCMNTCRNANHFCPMCGSFIGTYQC